MASLQGCEKMWGDEGLPKHDEVYGSMAAVTSGKIGVVAL